MNQNPFLKRLRHSTQGYPLYSQQHVNNPLIVAKLFDIAWSGTWYITEYDETEWTAFGYVTGLFVDEWGYIDINELCQLKWLWIYCIEFDRYFKPIPYKDFIKTQFEM